METDGTGSVKRALIDVARCSGCGRCVAACPLRIVTLEVNGYRKNAVIMPPELCNACGNCLEACPLGVVKLIPV